MIVICWGLAAAEFSQKQNCIASIDAKAAAVVIESGNQGPCTNDSEVKRNVLFSPLGHN